MSCEIIIDREKSITTNQECPVFPWVKYDAERFVFDEALINGSYLGLNYSGIGRSETRDGLFYTYGTADKGLYARFKRNHLMSFFLEVGGQLLRDGWHWTDDRVVSTGGRKESVVRLASSLAPVEVVVHTVLDGTSFVERWIDITNMGDQKMPISGLFPWSGIIFKDDRVGITKMEDIEFSLGYFKNANWNMEGEFAWKKLDEGTFKIETDRMVKFGPCCYFLRNDDTGEMAVINFEHTGGIDVEFTNCNNSYFRQRLPFRGNYLHAKIGLAGTAPIRVLDPGQTVSSPRVHLAMMHGDLDGCVNELHRHLRMSVIPPQPEDLQHPLAYNYAGYSHCCQTTREYVLNEIESAAVLGAELFMVDAGWYGPRDKDYSDVFGDWYETPGLENRLGECFDYARSKGMKCGLWVAVEILGLKSEFAAAHKDWFLRDGEREVAMLDISRPEVEEWMLSTISSLIDKYELDCFRIDGGYEFISPLNRANGRYVEDLTWLYCEKLHGIFERVRAKYPHLYLENCWGGGGRTDLGMMRRFHWSQLSDNQNPEQQLLILNGMTLAMPPEQCMIFAAPCVPQQTDADFLLRTGLFSQTCMVGAAPSVAKMNASVLERWRHMADIYKKEIRPILGTCKVYHHTPVQDYRRSGEWVVLEYAGRNADTAVVGFFRLGNSKDGNYHFKSKGLDISRNYQVWFDNERAGTVISGRELCMSGIDVLVSAPMRSELLIIKGI